MKMTETVTAEIKKQVEFYLGDTNLSKDDFFRELITTGSDGYFDIAYILKCNKIKKLGVNKAQQIALACKNSKSVEISADGIKIRRTGNASLPTKTASAKKRDAKAEEKKTDKEANNKADKEEDKEENTAVERDEQGRIIFSLQDFENTIIVLFKTADQNEKTDEDYKLNWRDLEAYIKTHFDQIKVVYSRSDKYEGHLAISQWKINKT